jgi:hypothetical protein
LEYQGETHYYSSHIFGRASDRKRADSIKFKFATDTGITLIPIPYWWDNSPSSLAATIQYYRPDLIVNNSTNASPIPSEMPAKVQRGFNYAPSYPKQLSDTIEPTGWLMMEKYDGVRVFWNGKQLLAKAEKIVMNVPRELSFPSIPFEGELW